MRTAPTDLDPDRLRQALAARWGFSATSLEYAPVGFGSHHWIATDASGERRFVTADRCDEAGTRARLQAAFSVAHQLRTKAGLGFVLSPLQAADGEVVLDLDGRYAVTVFPFVDSPRWPTGDRETSADRTAVADLLADLHRATPFAEPYAQVDDLVLDERGRLEAALDEPEQPWGAGPYAQSGRALLAARNAQVRRLLAIHDEWVDHLAASPEPWVITHGEPKPDNLLATPSGAMLIDWDTALLAPAARDLWWFGVGSPGVLRYRTRTGRAVTDEELLLYRLRWDLSEIGSYVSWFRSPHDDDEDTAIAWEALRSTLDRAASFGGGGGI